jgi:hypothetical protein
MSHVTKTVRIVKTRSVKTVQTKTVTTRTVRVRSDLLRFTQGNSKLSDAVFIFSVPAGWFCPFAKQCLSKVKRHEGRIKDGPHTTFRCFSATAELRPGVRQARWHNADLLKPLTTAAAIAELILRSLDPLAGWVRMYVSGDFHNQAMFDAWLLVARARPHTSFYGYTKSLPYWVARLDRLPVNMILTASRGGSHDHLIAAHGLRSARVVFSKQEAHDLGLELDHDDSHAMTPGPSFALLIHGVQPAGTPAAKALATLRTQGEWGYGDKARELRHRFALTMSN